MGAVVCLGLGRFQEGGTVKGDGKAGARKGCHGHWAAMEKRQQEHRQSPEIKVNFWLWFWIHSVVIRRLLLRKGPVC